MITQNTCLVKIGSKYVDAGAGSGKRGRKEMVFSTFYKNHFLGSENPKTFIL